MDLVTQARVVALFKASKRMETPRIHSVHQTALTPTHRTRVKIISFRDFNDIKNEQKGVKLERKSAKYL